MLTSGVFLNRSPFYLFSSAILPDWLVTEGLRHSCHPPTRPQCWDYWHKLCRALAFSMSQISKLRPLHLFINSHLLPSSSPFLSCQKGKVKPVCAASWCKVSLSSLREVPGAGLRITWVSGLCPQRSSFRPALLGPKDRSLNSSSMLTPRPVLLQSHWYLPHLTPPSIVPSIQPQPCHGTLVHLWHRAAQSLHGAQSALLCSREQQ